MTQEKRLCPLSPAHIVFIGAVQASVLLAFFSVELSLLPFAVFAALCAISPFITSHGFFLPIINRGSTGIKSVAITFDDGPDKDVTPALLALLSKHSVTATFFVTGENAKNNPDIIREILSLGHLIGNHSFSHDNFLMLRSSDRLFSEIESTQNILKEFGITPYAFRPPVGITNPRLRRVLLKLGMYCVTFSCRAFDGGNRNIKKLSKRILKKAGPGDIVLLHDNSPAIKTDINKLINEIEKIITGIINKGLKIVPLSVLIGREVMTKGLEEKNSPARSFYNQLAVSYDREQIDTPVSTARKKEYQVVSARLPEIISKSDIVLEIGAGTGIYTIPIARMCREIVALDISENMLGELNKKLTSEKINNVRPVCADIEKTIINEKFDIICSFSSFEYIENMESLVKTLSGLLNPGGRFYFTTSHRSLFRFFTQIGNALRQGIWLRSRSKREIRRILKKSGLLPVSINTHLFKWAVSGGMIIEVYARK